MRTSVTFSRMRNSCPGYSTITRNLVIILFFALSSHSVMGQQASAKGDFKVWAVPAEQKVLTKDKPEPKNLVWSREKKQITVAGAGNEHVPFQVVISAPVPEGWRPKAPPYPGS